MILQQGRDGYTGTTDAWLDSWSPMTTRGAIRRFKCAPLRSVAPCCGFELAGALPSRTCIARATLGLYSTERTNAQRLSVSLYQMKTAWEEEKATWEQADDLTPWQQPGVAGTADRLAEPAGSDWVGLDRAWHTFDVTGLVEQWAARPADNGAH